MNQKLPNTKTSTPRPPCSPPPPQSLLAEAAVLIDRYYKETPFGNQPHMISHEAEAWLVKYRLWLQGE